MKWTEKCIKEYKHKAQFPPIYNYDWRIIIFTLLMVYLAKMGTIILYTFSILSKLNIAFNYNLSESALAFWSSFVCFPLIPILLLLIGGRIYNRLYVPITNILASAINVTLNRDSITQRLQKLEKDKKRVLDITQLLEQDTSPINRNIYRRVDTQEEPIERFRVQIKHNLLPPKRIELVDELEVLQGEIAKTEERIQLELKSRSAS